MWGTYIRSVNVLFLLCPEQAKRQKGRNMTGTMSTRGPVLPSGLTPKQEQFAKLVAKGSNLSEAYRQTYRTEGMADKSIWQAAWQVSRNAKVAEMIERFQKANESMELHDSERARAWALERLKCEATGSETDGARIRAIELVMRHHGLLTDRVSVKDETERTAIDIRTMLEERLANRLGLTIEHEDIADEEA